MEERCVHGGQSIEVLLRHGASPGACDGLNSKRIRLGRIRNLRWAAARSCPLMLRHVVRVLVVALVVQLLLAGAFIVWAASGFPLP